MKRVLAIFFLTIYMVSTTELSQLLKLPVLIEHYFEHKGKNRGITFAGFLIAHYKGNHLENHPHNDDYEQDRKLPFIVHTDFLATSFVLSKPVSFEIEVNILPVQREKIAGTDDTFVQSHFLSSIWQPPKSC
ncbi:hypothetical protein GCM10023091_10420 [Ravibacter arvi]|uniref:Uncharacterized protein n=1 Tax=Ravibacter arvi TaxID=2051041 RepID=A0ABP8LRV9_9BACT